MDRFFQNLPEIIKQSAASPLGILALMIIALGALAFFFFKEAPVKVRMAIFAMLFVGVAALAGVIMHQSTKVRGPVPNPLPDRTDARPTNDRAQINLSGGSGRKYPRNLPTPTEAVTVGGAPTKFSLRHSANIPTTNFR